MKKLNGNKVATVSFRTSKLIKEALIHMAKREQITLAAYVDKSVREYLDWRQK